MDKSIIINSIIEEFNFKSDSDFARFIGITPQVLSHWKTRNTYNIDLLIEKFPDINPEFLLTGKGSVVKNNIAEEPAAAYNNMTSELIEMQKKYIAKLEEEIQELKKEHPKTNINQNVNS